MCGKEYVRDLCGNKDGSDGMEGRLNIKEQAKNRMNWITKPMTYGTRTHSLFFFSFVVMSNNDVTISNMERNQVNKRNKNEKEREKRKKTKINLHTNKINI